MNVEVGPADAEQVPAFHADANAGILRRLTIVNWPRAVRAFALTLVAFAAFVAAIAFGYDAMHAGKILRGVEVGGVDVGGLTRAEAEAVLRSHLPDPAAGELTLRLADAVETLPYKEVGRDYAMTQMLDQAQAASRDGSVVEQVRALAHGVSIPVAITWDDPALSRAIQAAVGRANANAADATIVRDGARYQAVPAAEGRYFDVAATHAAAARALADPTLGSATISATPTGTSPAVETAAAQAAVERVERAVGTDLTITAGGQSVTIPSDELRGWVWLVPGTSVGQWDLSIDDGPIAQHIEELKRVVDVAPVNATYAFEGRKTVVVEGSDGQQLDLGDAVGRIVSALESRAAGTAAPTVDLTLVPVMPDFTASEAQAIADQATVRRLASWTTRFTESPFNGDGINIKRPAKLINGTVVQPGEMFDFIDVAGPFTRRNGYTDGAAIQNGRTRLDGVLGGGLCSASTTLFNAVARAGFQIDERHNHSYYINRYPVGLDATIWENGSIRKSFRFTNDSQYPILIRAGYSTGRVTFEVWGVRDGRKVKFSKADVENEREAKNIVVYTDELAPGDFKRVEFRTDGFDSTVTRTVRDANGAIVHEDTFYSDYNRVDGIYQVGRYPGDPRAGTRIPASEYVRPGR